MPFTNVEKVRQHLSEIGAAQDSFEDVPLRLTGTAPAAVAHGQLEAGSVKVKSKEIGQPHAETLIFSNDLIPLARHDVIPDSLVAASDTSLGRIYTENIDYSVDYAGGQVNRIADGAIEAGSEAAVWYYCYTVHKEGEDYSVNLGKGTIRRLVDGSIEDGQVVFVDYRTRAGHFADSQISQAIAEADDRVLALIDAAHQNTMDQTLIIGETYLAVALLCRMKAIGSLSPTSSGVTSRYSQDWLALANHYERDGLRLLIRYLPSAAPMSAPQAISGGGRE